MIKTTDILHESIKEFVIETIDGLYYDEGRSVTCMSNGVDMGRCTNSARAIVDVLGGKVSGYYHNNNPSSIIGEIEGGHDFAIIGNYLVDMWYPEYWSNGKYIYDLTIADDMFLVAILYGDPTTWEVLD